MTATATTDGRRGPAALFAPGLLAALVFLTAGCDLPGRPKEEDRPIPEDEVMDFGTLYDKNCRGCHGTDGRMGPAPPLNDPLFLAVVPDEELLRVITGGRLGTSMPAFVQAKGGPLTAAQVKVLAEGLKPRWGAAVTVKDVPPYLVNEDKRGDHERGARVFARACAVCHGEDGKGVKRDKGPTLAINEPALLELVSDQALRRYVLTGRPDLGEPPMPNFAGKRPDDDQFKPLTDQEITDVVALLSYWRQTGAEAR